MNDNKYDCSCDDDYEKIKRSIEESNKNIKFCYIKGPTCRKNCKND